MTAPSPDLNKRVLGELQALQERIYQRDQTVTTELLNIKNKVSAMEVEISRMKGDIDMIKTRLGISSVEGRTRKFVISADLSGESIVDEVFKNRM